MLDHPLPWTTMRKVYKRIGLCRKPQADISQRRRVRDRIDLEVVHIPVIPVIPVELELHHPVHQPARCRTDRRCSLRMQREQPTTRVTDDPAGIVRAGDHLDP